jgi:hypothetical protein
LQIDQIVLKRKVHCSLAFPVNRTPRGEQKSEKRKGSIYRMFPLVIQQAVKDKRNSLLSHERRLLGIALDTFQRSVDSLQLFGNFTAHLIVGQQLKNGKHINLAK